MALYAGSGGRHISRPSTAEIAVAPLRASKPPYLALARTRRRTESQEVLDLVGEVRSGFDLLVNGDSGSAQMAEQVKQILGASKNHSAPRNSRVER